MSQKFLNPVEVNGQVSAEYLDLSTTTSHSVNAGEIAWNSVDGTFDIGLLNGVTLQAGQEMHFYGKATEAISNGNAVMFAGVQGDHILIAKADAVTINANPEYFMGIATQDFATNDFGYVTAFGNVRGIDTSAYTLGDILYYDSTTGIDGLLTPTMPSAPKAKIIVAAVVKVHATQGILAVRPHTMPRLKDIQDINVDTASAGEILQLQSDGVWENKTLSEAGIQPTLTNPVTGTGTTNYVSKFTGTTFLGNSQIFDNGTNIGIGTTSPSEALNISGTTKSILVENQGGATIGMTLKSTRSGWFQSINIFGGTSIANGQQMQFGQYDNGKMFFFNSGNFPIGFYTNGTEKLSITASGNVGIGTTSPTFTLDVQAVTSNVRVSSSVGTNRAYTQFANTGGTFNVGLDSSTGGGLGTNAPYAGTIMHYGNYPIVIGTNATERVRISNSGNVGIGVTNPQTRLDISNGDFYQLKLDNSISSQKLWFGSVADTIGSFIGNNTRYTNSLQFTPNFTSASGIYFRQDGSTEFFNNTGLTNGVLYTPSVSVKIGNTGNVGIGNTSPTQKLDVTGNIKISNNNSLMFRNAANNADIAIIQLTNTNQLNLGTTSSSVPSVIALHTNSTERMKIDASGNIGIGTTSPGARLDVVGLFDALPARILRQASYGEILRIGRNGVTETASINYPADGVFAINTASSERMRINASGNVGIGTTNPSTKLHVELNDNSYAPAAYFVNTNTGGSSIASANFIAGGKSSSFIQFAAGFLQISTNDTSGGYIMIKPKDAASLFLDNVSSTSRITIGSSNTASHPLRVTQQVSNVSIYADYDIVAYSDQSVKENVRPIENVINRINQSRGVLYDRIDSGEKNNIGFIAQELEVAFPELVVTNEDGTKAVKYQNTVAVLFEAIKEQQKQIDELKQIVNGFTE